MRLTFLLYLNDNSLSLSPSFGAFTACGWSRRPPYVKDNCEYIAYAVLQSRKFVVLQAVDMCEGQKYLTVKKMNMIRNRLQVTM